MITRSSRMIIRWLIACCFPLCLFAQVKPGKVATVRITAPSIQGNKGGEDPLRRLTIYLPPGYDTHDAGQQRYPVIYFLHGFTSNDSEYMANFHMKQLLDTAIARGQIRPVIIVLPDNYTRFRGSFYTNSPLTGNWSDFIAKDVVNYIDRHYRTLPDRKSRGLAGHSMGGFGAIKNGMLHADVFGAVYALSPARLAWGEGLTKESPAIKRALTYKNEKEIGDDFFAMEVITLARTFSPDEQKQPFQIQLPYRYEKDSAYVDSAIYKKWDAEFPINMIEGHLAALKSLRKLKLDWGRNENFPFIPLACMQFSKKLEAAGIDHFAEEYIGDHGNHIGGTDGRLYTDVFPFFNSYLQFR